MRMTRPACCAYAVSGHAAAPPTSVMNSRRLIAAPSLEQRIVPVQTHPLEGATKGPLLVKSRHMQCKTACPLYPRKRQQMRHMECPLRAKSGLMHCRRTSLFDHLIGSRKQFV